MDQLSTLLSRHAFHARVFYNGDFCGANAFQEEDKNGHLHIVRRGEVVFGHDDSSVLRIDEPSIVFYARGLNHGLRVLPGKPAALLCARIHYEGGRQNPLAKALPDCLAIPLKQVPNLDRVLDQLFQEADTPYPGQQMTLDRLCDVVMVQAIRHAYEAGRLCGQAMAGLADSELARALVLMHDDPARAWTLQQLAEVCGMSRSKFAKRFHELVQTTPADYLAGRRMVLAQSLLRKNKLVKVVAREAGYASQPAFTKAFTSRFGMSPREWLRAN